MYRDEKPRMSCASCDVEHALADMEVAQRDGSRCRLCAACARAARAAELRRARRRAALGVIATLAALALLAGMAWLLILSGLPHGGG